ncbi:hypothetical protein [Kitasatospora cineracea]|uniref:Phage Mu protein F like protein n=1 Tax=Kitasatospora cineracea TaxID=88074 RepID=A0A3N4RJS7_9ACTN|nr:hypothetical protein [Kitasatospora cineracea]RPE27290.1 hypothetical protein EDD38_7435 [Kitasatospora cineracea]
MPQATAEDLGTAHYLQQQRTVRRAADNAQLLWLAADPGDLDREWATLGPALVQNVTDGQLRAATPSQDYVAAVIAADNALSAPAGTVRAGAFAGRAADGRPLLSLLYESVIETKWRMLAGEQSAREAARGGLNTLLRATTTEVADAGRDATGVAITTNWTTTGYVRVLSPPSCARCVALAGVFYRHNQGFARHPRCDCTHMPVTRGHPRARAQAENSPRAYFDSLSPAEQDKVFTIKGAEAIRDGGDITQIVNARRRDANRPGMYTAEIGGARLKSTYDGTGRRGIFARRERERAIRLGLVPPSGKGFRLTTHRLLPEEIYRQAGSDRALAIKMLRRYAYII